MPPPPLGRLKEDEMDWRKHQVGLLRAERLLCNAARESASGGVRAGTARKLAAVLSATAAGAGAGAAAVAAELEEAQRIIADLPQSGSDALMRLASLFTTAHSALEAMALSLGARLLPLAEGQPKKPPVEEVARLLGMSF
jgi:hypothetical protein